MVCKGRHRSRRGAGIMRLRADLVDVERLTVARGNAARREQARQGPFPNRRHRKRFTKRKYRVLGDIDVIVNKTTIFNEDPTGPMSTPNFVRSRAMGATPL